MAGGQFPRVAAGERLELTQPFLQGLVQASRTVRTGRRTDRTSQGLDVDNAIVRVLNKTDDTRMPFEVLAIGDMMGRTASLSLAATYNNSYYEGTQVTTPLPVVWGVLQQGVGQDRLGIAMTYGVTAVMLYVTGEDDTHADIEPDMYTLKTGTSGPARILWKETGTGAQKKGIVLIGGGGGGAEPLKCFGMLNGIVDGGAGPWEVDHVSAISGTNPLADPEDIAEIVPVKNPLGFTGNDNGVCIFSEAKEANAALGIEAGDFYFDIIACPTS